MSKGRRVLLFICFFVVLPGVIAFVTEEPTPKQRSSVEQKSPTPSPSKSTCFDLRTEKDRIEEANDEKREETLKEINMLQKKFLLGELKELSRRGKITSDEFRQIVDISEGTPLERLESFAENFLEVSSTLDRLIEQKYLSPYLQKDVVALGEQLAASSNPANAFVLANRTCFDDLDILTAESLESINVKSGWGKKQRGADFASMLNKG